MWLRCRRTLGRGAMLPLRAHCPAVQALQLREGTRACALLVRLAVTDAAADAWAAALTCSAHTAQSESLAPPMLTIVLEELQRVGGRAVHEMETQTSEGLDASRALGGWCGKRGDAARDSARSPQTRSWSGCMRSTWVAQRPRAGSRSAPWRQGCCNISASWMSVRAERWRRRCAAQCSLTHLLSGIDGCCAQLERFKQHELSRMRSEERARLQRELSAMVRVVCAVPGRWCRLHALSCFAERACAHTARGDGRRATSATGKAARMGGSKRARADSPGASACTHGRPHVGAQSCASGLLTLPLQLLQEQQFQHRQRMLQEMDDMRAREETAKRSAQLELQAVALERQRLAEQRRQAEAGVREAEAERTRVVERLRQEAAELQGRAEQEAQQRLVAAAEAEAAATRVRVEAERMALMQQEELARVARLEEELQVGIALVCAATQQELTATMCGHGRAGCEASARAR